MVERVSTKSTRATRFLKKPAKESNPRFTSPEEYTGVPQKFTSFRLSNAARGTPYWPAWGRLREALPELIRRLAGHQS